jgi:hypothetical protein
VGGDGSPRSELAVRDDPEWIEEELERRADGVLAPEWQGMPAEDVHAEALAATKGRARSA